jgi:NifU-like protein involved in Fe-S cluster formation
VRTDVELKDGRVEALSQKVQACAFGQASAALVANHAAGRAPDDLSNMVDQLTAWLDGEGAEPDWPDITELAPALERRSRHGAILLPFRTLLAAITAAD